jgi:hypothetical protein
VRVTFSAASLFRAVLAAVSSMLYFSANVWAYEEITECKMDQFITCTPKGCEIKNPINQTIIRLIGEHTTEMGIAKTDSETVEYCFIKNLNVKHCEKHAIKWSGSMLSIATALMHGAGGSDTEILLTFDSLSQPHKLWTTNSLWGGIAHLGGTCSRVKK